MSQFTEHGLGGILSSDHLTMMIFMMKLNIDKNIVIYNARNLIKMKFVLVLCAFTLLESCTFKEYISLYNNTGREITIKKSENNEQRVVTIKEGYVLSFIENEIISFKNSSKPYGTFDLTLNGVVLTYQWNYLKSSYFMRREGFGPFSRIVYRFQNDKKQK